MMSSPISNLGKRGPIKSDSFDSSHPRKRQHRVSVAAHSRLQKSQAHPSNVNSQSTSARRNPRQRKTYSRTARVARSYLQGPSIESLLINYDAHINLESGRSEEALENAERVLKQDPKNIHALNTKAKALRDLDVVLKAMNTVKTVLKMFPFNFEGLKTKILLLLDQDRIEEALEECQLFKEQYPENLEVLNLLAETLRKNKDFKKAMRFLERVLKNDPHNSDALKTKILLLLEQGYVAKALSESKHFEKYYPRSIDALNLLAESLRRNKDFKEAMVILERFLTDNSRNSYALRTIELIDSDLKKEGSLDEFMQIASFFLDLGHFFHAIAVIEHSLSVSFSTESPSSISFEIEGALNECVDALNVYEKSLTSEDRDEKIAVESIRDRLEHLFS